MACDSGVSPPISPNAAHRRAGGADCLEALDSLSHRPTSFPQAADTPYSCCPAARLETDAGRLESRPAGYSAGYDRVSAHLRGGSPASARPLVRPLHRLRHPGYEGTCAVHVNKRKNDRVRRGHYPALGRSEDPELDIVHQERVLMEAMELAVHPLPQGARTRSAVSLVPTALPKNEARAG